MGKYTVIGFFADNGQRHCSHVEADDADEAEEEVRIKHDIIVCGVIKGHHTCQEYNEFIASR
jgi:hypothetical protein